MIQRQLGTMSDDLKEVRICLTGSEMSKDGGLVRRVGILETNLTGVIKDVRDAALALSKKEFYVRWLWGLVSFVLGTGFVEILRYLTPIKK